MPKNITTFQKLSLLFLCALGISFFAGSLLPQQVHALSSSSFQPGRIIDDSVFTNNTAMTPAQIQHFLDVKVDGCDVHGTQSSSRWNSSANRYYTRAEWGSLNGNPPPFTCINMYAENTATKQNNYSNPAAIVPGAISAAQIIWDAAQRYQINPQVLIATLQKEQGLVTDDWPWYNNQYRYAMGYACPDTGSGCDAQFSGFYNQMDRAAWQFRYYLTHPGAYNYWIGNNFIRYNPNVNCGGSVINVQNAATAALYIYTPYQPNQAALNNLEGSGDACSAYGNRNFWRYFNSWFGSSVGTSLVQANGQTVYLISNGNRYGVPSGEMLSNYNLASTPITPASDSYIQSLNDGGVLGTLFVTDGDPTVYVADRGVKHGIPSGTYCTAWGFNCGSGVRQLDYNLSNRLVGGNILQPLMAHGTTIYKMQSGIRQPYLSQNALVSDGYTGNEVTPIGSGYNMGAGSGTPIIENNALVKFANSPTVYFYINSHFYGIPDGTTYAGWFPNRGVYYDQFSQYASTPPAGTSVLSTLIKTGSGKTYLIHAGGKIDVTSRAAQWPAPLVNTDFDALLNSYPLHITENSKTTYRSPNGALSVVQGGKRLTIASMNDFYALGYNLDDAVQVDTDTLSFIPDGLFAVGEGSVFKVTDSSAVYLKGTGQTVYYLSSLDQLGQFQLKRYDPVLPVAQLDKYTTPQLLSSFVATDGSATVQYLVDVETKKWNFSAEQAQQWGIATPPLLTISANGPIAAEFKPTNTTLPSFALYKGTVYYGSGGYKHPITSYNRYLELGGNASNTFTAPKDFIDAAPTGSAL